MATLGLTHYLVQGRNGPGSIPVDGLNVGDAIGLKYYNDYGSVIASHEPFESVVSVKDHLQQTALTDLSIVLPFHIYTITS
jgi:hypothetical protein